MRSSAPAIVRPECGARTLSTRYSNEVEFVGLCDKNGKRVEAGRKLIGVECPTFTNFDEMLDKAKPELVMVTTVDSTHHTFIKRALERGIDVITEKPMVTEATQCQSVLDAEKKYKPQDHRHIQLSLRAEARKDQTDHSVGRDRQGHVGRFQLVSRHASRSGLFSPLASSEIGRRQSVGPQGDASFRSDQLVARRRSGRGHGLRSVECLRKERCVSRNELPPVPAQAQVPVLLGHDERRAADEALCRVRGR